MSHLETVWGLTEASTCIYYNSMSSETASSMEDCKQLCVDYTTDVCCSIEYNPDTDSCQLSSVTRYTVDPSSDFREPCHVPAIDYAERVDSSCSLTPGQVPLCALLVIIALLGTFVIQATTGKI